MSQARTFEMKGIIIGNDPDDPIEINADDARIDIRHGQRGICVTHTEFDRICDEVDAYRRAVRAANGVPDDG